MINICNTNFESQYAYINEKDYIHIETYISTLNKNDNITCNKGHKLIVVNGKKNRPHFRHLHKGDVGGNPMSQWHIEWQSNFPVTEICFSKKCQEQIKDRRADIVLEEHNIILEIQNSEIKIEEVNNREKDYALHEKKVIWLVNGNNSITVKTLEYSNRIYLEFISDDWKYKSFTQCNYIYIDIDSQIYKIYPNKIKSNMIDVQKPILKKE
jgi:competence CoiA-like predicted nuclease